MNATPTAPIGSTVVDYPVHLDIDRQEEYPRWLSLLSSILLIPHFIALIFVGIAAYFAMIGAFLAVLFTGRYPEGIFNFLVGVHRWAWRVVAYYYWMTSKYPPFSLDQAPGDTVHYSVEYPEGGG